MSSWHGANCRLTIRWDNAAGWSCPGSSPYDNSRAVGVTSRQMSDLKHGTASSRVALLLRPAEIQPLFASLSLILG